MKVVQIVEPGGPEVLRLAERPDPQPGPEDVVVRVHASGINRADLSQRRGRYPPPPGFPADIPGLEFAGTVESAGPRCALRSVGDRVMGLVGGAGYAERVVVPERETIRIPEGMSMAAAAGVPEAFMTAWDALVKQAALTAGEVVLIHAVGSGVGTAAVQIGRVLGARTVGTSRTAAKVQRALEIGLDEGIVAGPTGDWAEEVGRLVPGGVDVVLDLVGADYLAGNLRALGPGARWMVVGVPGGSSGTIELRALMSKRASMTGTVLRPRSPEEKAHLTREFERKVVPLFESARLEPVPDRTFPAESAAEAHQYVETNQNFGTVALSWDVEGDR